MTYINFVTVASNFCTAVEEHLKGRGGSESEERRKAVESKATDTTRKTRRSSSSKTDQKA